jgi:hypothetical protein
MLLHSILITGVLGIGKVNAIEILSSFPGLPAGLKEFRQWVFSGSHETKPTKPTRQQLQKCATLTEKQQLMNAYQKQLFKYKHRNIRSKWQISVTFPDIKAIEAYR